MDLNQLEIVLRDWGRVYGERGGGHESEDRSPTGNSPLAALGRGKDYRGHAEGRSGKARRLLMGIAAGLQASNGRALMAPAAYIDPIACTASRAYRAPDFDRRETTEVGHVQQAWLVLHRTNTSLAEILRIQYQTNGNQYTKAEALEMSLRQYKEDVKLARIWMMGKLSR